MKPKKTRTSWQPGQSGNPKGRPKDQEYRDAITYLKGKSLPLMKKACELAEGGSEKVLVAFLNKICPDKLDLPMGAEGLKIIVEFVKKPE